MTVNKFTCVFSQVDNAVSKITFENCRFSIFSKVKVEANSTQFTSKYMNSFFTFFYQFHLRSHPHVNSMSSLETIYIDELPVIFEFYMKKPTLVILDKQKIMLKSSESRSRTPSIEEINNLSPIESSFPFKHTLSTKKSYRKRQLSISDYYTDTDLEDYYDIMERDDDNMSDSKESSSSMPSSMKPLFYNLQSSISKYIHYPAHILPYVQSSLKKTIYKYTSYFSNTKSTKDLFSPSFKEDSSEDESESEPKSEQKNSSNDSIPYSNHYHIYSNPYSDCSTIKTTVFSINSIGIKSTYTLRCHSSISNIQLNSDSSTLSNEQNSTSTLHSVPSTTPNSSKRSQIQFSINIDKVNLNINYIFSKYIQWFLDTQNFKGGWRILFIYDYIKCRFMPKETKYDKIQKAKEYQVCF